MADLEARDDFERKILGMTSLPDDMKRTTIEQHRKMREKLGENMQKVRKETQTMIEETKKEIAEKQKEADTELQKALQKANQEIERIKKTTKLSSE